MGLSTILNFSLSTDSAKQSVCYIRNLSESLPKVVMRPSLFYKHTVPHVSGNLSDV